MRTLVVLTSHVLGLAFSRKSRYLLVFVAPVAVFLGAMMIFGSPATSAPTVLVVGQPQDPFVDDLAGFIGADLAADWDSVEDSVRSGRVDVGVLVPDDRGQPIELVGARGATVVDAVRSEIDLFVAAASSLTPADFSRFVHNGLPVETAAVQDTGVRRDGAARGVGFFVFLVLMQAFAVAQLTIKEREESTLFRILVAPVRPRDYVIANVAAAYLVVGLQTSVALTVAVFALGINLGAPFGSILILLLCFGLPAVGLGFAVTSFAETSSRAAFASTLVIMPTSMLAGCFWPSSFMPEGIQRLARLFPQTWVMEALDQLQFGAQLPEVLGELAVLLAFAVLFAVMSALKPAVR
jgi:ABC-2 type transport system permease protein